MTGQWGEIDDSSFLPAGPVHPGSGVFDLFAAGVATQIKKPGKAAQDPASPVCVVPVLPLFTFNRFQPVAGLAGLRFHRRLFRIFFHLGFCTAFSLRHESDSPKK